MKRLCLVLLSAVFIAGCGETKPETDIWTAAASGDNDTIARYIEIGRDIDSKDEVGGSSPLIVAAVYGQTDVARMLLENGASLNLRNNDGSTALHAAAFFGHPGTVGLLLDHGADLQVINNFGQTPLDAVADPWSAQLEDTYRLFGDLLKIELDLQQIREARPVIARMIREHG